MRFRNSKSFIFYLLCGLTLSNCGGSCSSSSSSSSDDIPEVDLDIPTESIPERSEKELENERDEGLEEEKSKDKTLVVSKI